MRKKLVAAKSKIQKHLPEIASATALVAAAAIAFYAKHSPQLEAESDEEKTFRIALNDCCFEDLKNGEPVVWKIDGHTIDLAYDPEC